VDTVVNQERGKNKQTEQIRYDANGKAEVVGRKTEPDAPLKHESYLINEEIFAIDIFLAIFLALSSVWQRMYRNQT